MTLLIDINKHAYIQMRQCTSKPRPYTDAACKHARTHARNTSPGVFLAQRSSATRHRLQSTAPQRAVHYARIIRDPVCPRGCWVIWHSGPVLVGSTGCPAGIRRTENDQPTTCTVNTRVAREDLYRGGPPKARLRRQISSDSRQKEAISPLGLWGHQRRNLSIIRPAPIYCSIELA